jgi:hypothetical protein
MSRECWFDKLIRYNNKEGSEHDRRRMYKYMRKTMAHGERECTVLVRPEKGRKGTRLSLSVTAS